MSLRRSEKSTINPSLMPAATRQQDPAAAPEVFSYCVSERTAFESLAVEWDELLDASSQQSYFMRWRWNFLWWMRLAPANARLMIVVCRTRAGVLVGLCPLYTLRRKAFNVMPLDELVFLGTGVGLKTSEHMDIAVRRGFEDAAVPSMAAALRDRNDWDRLSCSRVSDNSPVVRGFLTALAQNATVESFERAPYVDTSRGWSGYKSSLGRSMRRNVEYYARRLFKRYQCEFQRVRTDSELQVALDALMTLHIAQWTSRGEIGSLSNPPFQEFLREAATYGVADDRARVWTLRIEGRIEAVLLGFLDGGVLHFFQKGHNPSFASEDLGTALVSLCIRDCCEDPAIRAFDFMGGGASYKELWAREVRNTILGEVNRNTLGARAFALQCQIDSAARAVYRAVIPQSIRAVRRDWLKARFVRQQLRRLTHPVAGTIAGTVAISNELMECLVEFAEVVLPIAAQL